LCDGSGVVQTDIVRTGDLDEIDSQHRELVSTLSTLLETFALERPCGSCNGTGSIVDTREKRLEDLTGTQKEFLYQANLERIKAKNGGEEAEKQARQIQQNTSSSQEAMMSQSSPTPGSPTLPGGGTSTSHM